MPRRRRSNLDNDSIRARRIRLHRAAERAESQSPAAHSDVLRNTYSSLTNAAFSYDPTIAYNTHPLLDIGAMNQQCRFCAAFRWKGESPGICCSNGKTHLPLIEEPPEVLSSLLNGLMEKSKHFLINIRKYNSCFQMTSFGADKEVHHGGFQPTFIIQGQIYHRIGSLLPTSNQDSKFLQIYFMGNNEGEANQRMNNIQGLQQDIVRNIQDLLHEHNQLVLEFKTALDMMPNDSYRVVINADRIPAGRHPGTFNAPVANEIAAIISGNEYGSRDIVLKKYDNSLMRVSDTHRFYDALQYPLIFWKGQETYSINIPQVNPITKQAIANKKVSAMNFYAYHMMIRPNHNNNLMKYGTLFHQFAVDAYVKVKSERLRYVLLNQTHLRADSCIHLRDAVASDGNISAGDLGRRVILPSSFVNSPRYLNEYTQDAFTYVRKFGRPDFFITLTCNPTWPEMTNALMQGQKQTDRHDIIARVFKQKLIKFINVITKGLIFGETAAFMYSVEWQKRGLPHCHILVWLKNKIQPSQIDSVISAEIPYETLDPYLRAIVLKNMVHGPCGELNPNSPCMKQGRCSKKYPRQLIKETIINENGYPLYRRRAPCDGGMTASIKMRNSVEITIDNRWIVPYSPLLSKMFGAHINIESCSSVKAIKYICKYINKGSDQATFHIEGTSNLNEVNQYQFGRYVSSNEAFWRLFSFNLHERDPAVIHLALHLENGERVYFTAATLQERVNNPPRSTLTAFFHLCSCDEFAKTLFYCDVPKYYTWNASAREWKRRIQGIPVPNWPGVKETNTLGRVYTVSANQFQCFCVRLLLHNVKGSTSFQSLRTVNGVVCNTFQEACELLGLLENDNHWLNTMEEAVLCQSPKKLRQLFCILISSCGLSNPQVLWNSYKNALSEDLLNRNSGRSIDNVYNEALTIIENGVISMCGKNLQDFGMPRPQMIVERQVLLDREYGYNHVELNKLLVESLPKLLPEQRTIFDFVDGNLKNNESNIIFIDAPGGTGKTYLLNLILARVRIDGQIAVAVASSGIAATLLKGGRTAHSALKLPLDIGREEMPMCNIAKNSEQAQLLQQARLIVWDEATMSHKKALEALDRTLQDLRNDSRPMGGLVVILGGDFRQTLPVIARGTPADELDACLKSSYLWPTVKKFSLTKNMRVHLHNDAAGEEFSQQLLKIGDGTFEVEQNGQINLSNMCTIVKDVQELIDNVFPNIALTISDENWLGSRAILAPKNNVVDEINEKVLQTITGEEKVFYSIDFPIDSQDLSNYPVEFLNSLNLSGVPSHKLTLKVGAPIILMRNIDSPRLCNGTRLSIIEIGQNLIKAKIISGSFAGEHAMIPKIPIIPSNLPFQFKRLQFPIKLAFAITINKAQGQSLTTAGVHLDTPCFAHGQLYVACSRVSKKENLFVLAKDGRTENIVYKRALI